MKAIAVHPGRPNSMHLAEVPEPRLDDIPDGRGVLVGVLRVGVDGTDKEINAAEYGMAPEGDDYLITGHEGLGRVLEVGPNVPSTIVPGTLVVATVRRPGHGPYDAIGLQDMTTDDVYYERGINLRHGFLTERYVEDARYIVPLPESLNEVGVLLEPLTVAEKAIAQAFESPRRLKVWQPRRALVLGSGTIGLLAALALRLRGIEVTCASLRPAPYRNSDLIEVPADAINQGFVLGNKVMVGSVNASPADFASGRDDLVKASPSTRAGSHGCSPRRSTASRATSRCCASSPRTPTRSRSSSRSPTATPPPTRCGPRPPAPPPDLRGAPR
jgi:threonine dehydrogenase-like Zn-dependent dehydrogenase